MVKSFSPQLRKPTINDVARLSGVSKKTVSRVLNDSEQVTETTRNKVVAVIKQLNYAPDPQARGLASKRSFILGLVYDNPNNIYISDVQRGILNACHETGFELIMHPADYDDKELTKDVIRFVTRARIGGLILLSPISQIDTLARRLQKDHVPYVRISPREIDAADRVVVSHDKLGAELMTEYLLSIGHRNIGFVKGPEVNLSTHQKYEGFLNILNKHGLPVQENFIVDGENTFDSGEMAGNFLLKRKDRPTAIFASNDAMALGVIKSAAMLDIRVPEQLSVAGYDDSILATMTWPDLSTVRQPVRQLGELAARKLLEQLSGSNGQHDSDICTQPELIVRNSTQPTSGIAKGE